MSKTVHELKCAPDYWDALERGDKNFEVRRDDRGFQKGDYIVLQKYKIGEGFVRCGLSNSKQELCFKITYVLTGGQLGIEPGYVVMGLRKAYRP